MNKKRFSIFVLSAFIFFMLGGLVTANLQAASSLAARLAGRILLQVESKGEAWYVDPVSLQRSYLGRGADCFDLMRTKGLGITDADLNQISLANTETPAVEENISNQPAYLINAYLKNGKNYIDVDYVEWLHGETSIKAQVEDGKCTSTNNCNAYPNGYKRNQNPKIRTFEVSPSATIKVSAYIASELNAYSRQNLSISFEEFADVVSELKPYLPDYPHNPPFKESKTFITIDVKDNIVTKIIEPYQE